VSELSPLKGAPLADRQSRIRGGTRAASACVEMLACNGLQLATGHVMARGGSWYSGSKVTLKTTCAHALPQPMLPEGVNTL
jgi:hypothetical protein